MLNLGNVFILGDSYSSFEGYIPKENLFWYNNGGHENTDVTQVSETWWSQLLSQTNSNLILNDSFSGSTVCNTEREEIPHTSFIYRLEKYINTGFFKNNTIDTIFIFGGTNDSWINAPIGQTKYSDFSESDLHLAIPGFCYLLSKLKQIVNSTKIYVIINRELNDQIVDGYVSACDYYKVNSIMLDPLSLTGGHPNKKGMTQIKDQVLKHLKSY